MKKKLKIGIALDSLTVSAWKISLMEKIQGSDHSRIELFLLLNSQSGKNASNANTTSLFKLHRKFDARFFPTSHNGFFPKNIQDTFPKIELITNLENNKIDVLLWLKNETPPTDFYQKSLYGIWFFSHGHLGQESTNESVIGYHSFFQKQETSTSSLLIKRTKSDTPIIAYQSWSMPHAYAWTRSQNEEVWKITSFVPRALKQLHQVGETIFFSSSRTLGSGKTIINNNTPTFFNSLQNIVRHFVFLTKRILQNLLSKRQWILLFHIQEERSESFSKFKKLTPSKDKFWADPFLWQHEGEHFIFFEELPFATEKGHISVLKIDSSGKISTPEKILDLPYHLSYPFLFEFEKTLYMIPESFSNRNIQLFECTNFPNQWQHKMNLMEDLIAADTTLFFHQNKWWMFTSIDENNGESLDDELFLFYADSPLTSEWTPHPMNPIVSDVRRARPAGNLFIDNGKIIRPSQDCSKVYGHGLNFNQIEILSETDYQEKLLTNIRPDWDKNLHRVHSYNFQNGLTIIDGMIHRNKYV